MEFIRNENYDDCHLIIKEARDYSDFGIERGVPIYTQFQKIPKVGGGTDYEQIWNYVNASRKRRRELSLIITDFEYTAPRRFVKHPKNLFYVPCSNMDWRSITHYAESFCRSAAHIDPAIRSHLLF